MGFCEMEDAEFVEFESWPAELLMRPGLANSNWTQQGKWSLALFFVKQD